MALFGFGKKKDEEKNIPACACQSDCATFEATEEDANKVKIEDGAMSVKVLGVGCASCHEQYEQAKAAVKRRWRYPFSVNYKCSSEWRNLRFF